MNLLNIDGWGRFWTQALPILVVLAAIALTFWLVRVVVRAFKKPRRDNFTTMWVMLLILGLASCKKEPAPDARVGEPKLQDSYYETGNVKADTLVDINGRIGQDGKPSINAREGAPDLPPVPPLQRVITLSNVDVVNGHSVTIVYLVEPHPLNGGSYITVLSMTSGMTGLSAGWSWLHIGGTWVNYPGSSLIYGTAYGKQQFGLKINLGKVGFDGTFLSYDVEIDWIYNTKTGVYSFSVHYMMPSH